MPVTGKMTVDLYANPDPFIQGMKAAENSAKRSGEGIAGHLDKINAKQMKNVVGGALKTVGVVGAIEVGQQIMLATIKGMADGTVKGMGDFGMVAAQAVTSVIKSIPVLGTFMDIGEEIGKWVTGINELNVATEKTKQNFNEMEKVLDLFNTSEKTGTSGIEKTIVANNQYGMSDDEITRQNVISQMQKEDHAANSAYIETQRKAARELAAEEVKKFGTSSVIRETELSLIGQISKLEDRQLEKRNETNNEMLKNQDEKNKKQQEDNDLINWFNETLDEIIDQENTLSKIKKEQLATQMDAEKDLLKAQEDFDKTEAGLEGQAANLSSTTGVSSAIGNVKVAGAADFSIEKQLSMAQESLQAANDSVEYLRIIADQVKTAGATT